MDHIKNTSGSVVLAEEDRRFAMDAGHSISGCIRIELSGGRGLTAVSVDNIRFFPRGEYVYKLIFADSGQDKQRYHIAGNLSLSAYGRGEAGFCINPADLDGTGTGLSDLSTVLVAAMSTVNPDEALHPVLRGALPSSSEGSAEGSSTTADNMTAATEKRDSTATAPSHDNTAGPRSEHSIQDTSQPASGDTRRQIYRQRQNTHTVTPGRSSIPDGTGEPVRSPRAEAFYNRNSISAETGSSTDAKTANEGKDISASEPASPASSPDTGRGARQMHADASPRSDTSSPTGHTQGSARQTAADRPSDAAPLIARTAGTAESGPPPDKDYSLFYYRSVLEKCAGLAGNCSASQYIVPFDRNFADASWKKITDTSLFPLLSPGSKEPLMKYGHFIFGWCGTHYLIGVPGRFLPEEQPDSGRSGFVYWLPIAGMPEESTDASLTLEERRKDIYGYWIAPVNRSTGHIEEIPLIEN